MGNKQLHPLAHGITGKCSSKLIGIIRLQKRIIGRLIRDDFPRNICIGKILELEHNHWDLGGTAPLDLIFEDFVHFLKK